MSGKYFGKIWIYNTKRKLSRFEKQWVMQKKFRWMHQRVKSSWWYEGDSPFRGRRYR